MNRSATSSLDRLLALIQTTPRRVVSRRRIEQAPASKAPAIPRGEVGDIEWIDEDAGTAMVTFDEPYGATLVDESDVRVIA